MNLKLNLMLARGFKGVKRESVLNQQRKSVQLEHRELIEPEWSTTREPLNVDLKLSERHEITKSKSLKMLRNQYHRAKLQLTRNSTCDPYIKVMLNPLGSHFQTLPIYGGGYHVGFGEYDEFEKNFKISEKELIEMKCTLHILAFDSDVSSNDNFIGENEIILNIKSGVNCGLIKDIRLFSTIPIASSNGFAGKVELSVLWTDEYLQVSILNATHLATQEYKGINEDRWLMMRCVAIFILVFGSGLCLFCWSESWKVSDALWFLLVTTTTVGYGDIVPQSDLGKILNCFYLIVSTVLLGWSFSVMMNYVVSLNSDKNGSYVVQNANPNEPHNLQTYKKTLMVNLFIIIILVAIVCIFFTFIAEEKWSWADSLLFAFATISTVGYGDKTPSSHGGRAFAAVFMIIGTILLAKFAANIMEYLLIKRHQNMVTKIMGNSLITKEQIKAFDVDGDGGISKFEYLSKMLILTNEVQPAVINKIMDRFNKLDVDNDGSISVGDFELELA